MRKVLKNHSEVAHVWANRTQDEGRASDGRIFFENGKIYSYGHHFCIARWVGDNVLFTYQKYSSSTAKHINYVRRAIPYGTPVIMCYSPESRYSEQVPHLDNIHNYKQRIGEDVNTFIKKRIKSSYFVSGILDDLNQVEKYCELFDIDERDYISEIREWTGGPAQEMIEKFEARELELKAARETPQYLAKKEREKKRMERANLNKSGEALRKWLRGDTYRLDSHNFVYDYLRLENNHVMTTQRVEIPTTLAVKFYERIKSGILTTGDRIMDWEVRDISDNVVRIGCHTFKIAYLKTFGRHLSEKINTSNN